MNWLRIYGINLLVILVFVLAFLLRFSYLTDAPKGLYPDETAIGYNAYSILLTGRDEFGILHPLYFKSFDDFKLPLYIYSTSASIKLFGATDFSVRVTSALFGSLSIVFIYFLVFVLSRNKYIALLSSLFLTLNPWHLLFSRAGYEVNVATSLMLLGTLLFVISMKRNNNLSLMLLSVLPFVLSVYTYSVTRLIAPLILIGLFILYRKSYKNSLKKILPVLLLFGIGMIPFAVSFFTLQSEQGFSSQKDALLVGNAVKAQFIETRSYFTILPSAIQKLMFSYPAQLIFAYIKNLVSFFSAGFYFVTGSDHPNQNIHGMAMFYYFEFPLIIIGAYEGIKKRAAFIKPFAVWLFVIFIFVSIIVSVPNGTRSYPVVIPFTVLSAFGFYVVVKRLILLKNRALRLSSIAALVLLIVYSYLYFLLSFFIRYPVESAKDWRSEDRRTVEFITKVQNRYSHIVFDDSAQFFYTSLLYYGKINPFSYQSTAKYKNNGLVTTLVGSGKYSFESIDWKNTDPQKGFLYITGKDNVPKDKSLNILATINYPKRPIGIYYDRKIGQLTVEDTAYVIFEKK